MHSTRSIWRGLRILAPLILISVAAGTDLFAQSGNDCGTSAAMTYQDETGTTRLRPVITNEQIRNTPNFKIHYTITGFDSTSQNWIDSMAVYLEYARNRDSALGWPVPPPDNNHGGDNLYDIYVHKDIIEDQDRFLGLTARDGTTNNISYPDGQMSWIELVTSQDSLKPLTIPRWDRLRALVAHELHHSIQLVYSSTEEKAFYENTSVYMEHVVYRAIDRLPYFLNQENSPLTDYLDRGLFLKPPSNFWYAGGLWPRFLHEYYDSTILSKIWDKLGRDQGLNTVTGIDDVLQANPYHSSLDVALTEYAVWKYFTGTRADAHHFKNANAYPTSSVMVVDSLYPNSGNEGDAYYELVGGTEFMEFVNGTASLILNLNADNSHRWKFSIISYRNPSASLEKTLTLNSSNDVIDTTSWTGTSKIVLVPVMVQTTGSSDGRSFNYTGTLLGNLSSVRFTNQIGDSNAGGRLMLNKYLDSAIDTVISGTIRNIAGAYTVYPFSERFVSDSIYKHLNWNSDQTRYLLENDFSVQPSEPNQLANFVGLVPAAIRNEMIDGPQVNGGTMQFRDPWYLHSNNTQPDSFFTYTTMPFSPTGAYTQTSGGVFLNQGGTPPLLTPPYYSVKTSQTQSIGAYAECNFLGWAATNATNPAQFTSPTSLETPVIFRSANDTIKARYKTHLGSSLATATGYNNQRKLVKRNTTYHLVYPSAGDIWYTSSTDNGATWSPEQLVSAANEGTQRLNPAIDVGASNNVYVAYEIIIDATHRFLLIKNKSGGIWNLSFEQEFLASADMKPVIAITTKVVAVAQAIGVSASDPGLYCVDLNNGSTTKVSETSSASLNPTLGWYNLAYQDGNAIYHKRLDYTTTPVSFSSRTMISTVSFNGRSLTNISNPSLALRQVTDGDRRPVIAWQATDQADPNYRPIFVRCPVGHSTDGTPTFVTTAFDWLTPCAHGRAPTVSCYMTPTGLGYENPDISLVWQDDPNPNGSYQSVVAANKINGVWGSPFKLNAAAQYASVAQGDISQSGNGGALQVCTAISGPPYNLQYAAIPAAPPVPTQATLLSPANNSTNVGLSPTLTWSCMFDAETYDLQVSATSDFAAPVVDVGDLAATNYNVAPDEPLNSGIPYWWHVRAHNTSGYGNWSAAWSFTTTLPSLSLSTTNGNHPKLQWSVPTGYTAPYKVYRYYCTVEEGDCFGSPALIATISDPLILYYVDLAVLIASHDPVSTAWYYAKWTNSQSGQLSTPSNKVNTGTSNIYWKAGIGREQEELPTESKLSVNYPNPFNPTTTFEYQLDQPGHVSFVICNVLGQEVARLVEGMQGAGYFKAVWEAAHEPSGIYYARFLLTDGSGKEVYSRNTKILLVK